MLLSPPPDSDLSLLMIEGGLTVIAIALAFSWPRLGMGWFSRLEKTFASLARRRRLSVFAVGGSALVLRLAILPFCPIPLPFAPGDFSFLLAADTFAHGRLTNPTPKMWIHFESIHITMQPTYMSMYFPAQGLILAAGKVLFGHPWFGVLASSVLMSAAICWMLQAWMPPGWALLGGLLAVMRLCLFSYWINTYHAAGMVSALGGALVLGSLPRLIKPPAPLHRHAFLLALGIAILATTRPFEGLLLCLPVAVVLARWILFDNKRPPTRILFSRAAGPLALVVAAGACLAIYDYRAFGSPKTLPYTVNRTAYAVAPYFVWQHERLDPGYRHDSLRRFYYEAELPDFKKIHSPTGFVIQTLAKATRAMLFFGGFLFLPLIFQLRRVVFDRRIRFLVLGVLVLAIGMSIQVFLVPHYLAPFTSAFYAIGLQAMRHLKVWTSGGQPVGATLVRLTVSLCVLLCGVRLAPQPLHLRLALSPASEWTDRWYGPGRFGTERTQIETSLEQFPGKQIVLVRYAHDHKPMEEWVYNSSDIDNSKVIWARDMNPRDNLELLQYYKDRHVWLVEPDNIPATLQPYTVPVQMAVTAH